MTEARISFVSWRSARETFDAEVSDLEVLLSREEEHIRRISSLKSIANIIHLRNDSPTEATASLDKRTAGWREVHDAFDFNGDGILRLEELHEGGLDLHEYSPHRGEAGAPLSEYIEEEVFLKAMIEASEGCGDTAFEEGLVALKALASEIKRRTENGNSDVDILKEVLASNITHIGSPCCRDAHETCFLTPTLTSTLNPDPNPNPRHKDFAVT